MKLHIYLLATVLFVFLLGGSLCAQPLRAPGPVDTLAAREAHVLSVKLRLNREQKVTVYHLTRQNMAQMDSVRRLSVEPGIKAQTLAKLAKDYRGALKGLFTPEQYTAYEALVAEQRRKFEARHKNARELPQ